MPTWGWIPIGIAIAVVIVIVALLLWRVRRSTALRRHFGPEYDRTVGAAGRRRTGETVLRRRERDRARLDIRPLPEAARVRYAEQWTGVQEEFVDQPDAAVMQADTLLTVVMSQRGYPIDDFESQADLISVDHPELVRNYRIAHQILRQDRDRRATTEQLREAILRYRSLFDELLQSDGPAGDSGRSERSAARTGAPTDDSPKSTHPRRLAR